MQIEKSFDECIECIKNSKSLIDKIESAGQLVISGLKKNQKIIIFGNGGSAADAQHMACELICKYKKERKPLPAIALTTDTSALTAISNDYSFEDVFSRQIDGLCKKGDVVIGITTSGSSENVIRAIKKANKLGAKTICLLGNDGGRTKGMADIDIIVPSNDTARIQEAHSLIIHCICELVDEGYDN